MQAETPRQGFDQVEQEHLPSKERQKHRQINTYFSLPEAKPLLSKISIDPHRPKILIRSHKFDLEYPELLKAPLLTSSTAPQKNVKREPVSGESSLWRRFIISGMYKCLYMKYHVGKLEESQRRGKKLKNQLYRSNLNNEWLLATYVVDMSFLSQTTAIMARNLFNTSLTAEHQQIEEPASEQIIFDSTFENGNLMYAFAKAQKENARDFYLLVQNDVNTKGYGNWFYFKFYSLKTGPLKFSIVNLQKYFSYFGQGMKPYVYSLKEGKGWKMQGTAITYTRNDLLKSENSSERYNTLTFTIEQKHPNDTLVIAAGLPYTYSRLLSFLQALQKATRTRQNLYFRRQTLAKTISGNECPLITMTLKRDRKADKSRKKIVFVIARQHPSETVGSWVCEGVLLKLIDGSSESDQLLKKYIFKIIPMVNIDGVVYGNSRCDISGTDINRKWTKNSNQTIYPIVTSIRRMATELIQQGYELQYFLDLHGHSRKLGSFMYCCKGNDDIESRIFAWLMSKHSDKFVFEECRFGVSNFRKETARGYFGGLLANRKAITLETSFFGYKCNGIVKPFTPADLRDLGSSLVMTVHSDTFKINKVVNWADIRNQIKMGMFQRKSYQSESSGSDSDPQGEELSANEKATAFLSPTLATKIGLVDIKIVQKSRKQVDSLSPEFKRQENSPLHRQSQGLLIRSQTNQTQQLMQSQTLTKRQNIGGSRLMGLRQTRSVTKIEPFQFKSLQKRDQKGSTKRIRIAIDVQRIGMKEPRRSTPTLPQVRQPRKKQQFWSHLQQEYQTIMSEKKTEMLLQAKKQLNVQIKYRY